MMIMMIMMISFHERSCRFSRLSYPIPVNQKMVSSHSYQKRFGSWWIQWLVSYAAMRITWISQVPEIHPADFDVAKEIRYMFPQLGAFWRLMKVSFCQIIIG